MPSTRSIIRLTPSIEWLLVFVPVSIAAEVLGLTVAVFIGSALAIIPLAGLIGRSTEQVAVRVGARLGGLLNATLGNITELIVSVFLISAGDFAIVKASLVGSIVGNLLLVLGISLAAGGIGHKEQSFDSRAAGVHSASLLLAVAGLVMPALLIITTPQSGFVEREVLSSVVAIILIALYFAALAFTQITHAHLFHVPERVSEATWTMRRSVATLSLAAILVAVESELLVSSLRPAIQVLQLPALFVGLIVIPIIGNAAEHASAVFFAVRDRVDLTLEIAVGSSTQIAMFVAPLLVFISLVIGHPMDFVFTAFEIAVVSLATLIVGFISLDGRSNWLAGVQLAGAYLAIAATAFFVK
ncbi:MAG TPA: calcium/proton exchanger [Candidatus Baltobacterales bacterium]|nr:calcium/proton exchanger [Candidatus Baltobacterales bacterium]